MIKTIMPSIEILSAIAMILALMIAIIGHEIMHGYVAYMHGDTTAKSAGRLSINPISHIDPIGSIVVPAVLYIGSAGFLFGWAKPVPVNTQTVINNGGYNAAMQVSLAGIAYNLFVATLASLALLGFDQPTEASSIFYIFTYIFIIKLLIINVVLAVFNLIPIPQFDGAHFVMYLALKFNLRFIAEFFYKAERYGMIIVVIVLISPLKDYLLIAPVRFILSLLQN